MEGDTTACPAVCRPGTVEDIQVNQKVPNNLNT